MANTDAKRVKQTRDCMACTKPFVPFLDGERVCSPRCAGDLARMEHVDLRLDTHRKTAPVYSSPPRLRQTQADVGGALAQTRAIVDQQRAEQREAGDLLNDLLKDEPS